MKQIKQQKLLSVSGSTIKISTVAAMEIYASRAQLASYPFYDTNVKASRYYVELGDIAVKMNLSRLAVKCYIYGLGFMPLSIKKLPGRDNRLFFSNILSKIKKLGHIGAYEYHKKEYYKQCRLAKEWERLEREYSSKKNTESLKKEYRVIKKIYLGIY